MPYREALSYELLSANHRNDDGTLPSYIWPGGYPIVYEIADEGMIMYACPKCANEQDKQDGNTPIVSAFIHYEGSPIECEWCNTLVDSAYGDLDEPEGLPTGQLIEGVEY